MNRNTDQIECLVQSLLNVIEAKNAHDKAREERGDDGEWGYYGRTHVADIETAAEDFEKRLVAFIDNHLIEQTRIGGHFRRL